VNPVLSEALDQLRIAAEECSQLIKEVEEYDWTYGPYPPATNGLHRAA